MALYYVESNSENRRGFYESNNCLGALEKMQGSFEKTQKSDMASMSELTEWIVAEVGDEDAKAPPKSDILANSVHIFY